MIDIEISSFKSQFKKRIQEWIQCDNSFCEEEALNYALSSSWPIRGQYKLSLQPYIEAIQNAFGCTFLEERSKDWDITYRFQIGEKTWFLSQGEKAHDYGFGSYLITLNYNLAVGHPEELVEMLHLVSNMLPEMQTYAQAFSKKPLNYRGPSKDRIGHYRPSFKQPPKKDSPFQEVSEELLNRKFSEYNRLYFGESLPPCPILICQGLMDSPRHCDGAYYPLESVIRLDYYSTYYTDGYLRALILHEMIHHYIHSLFPQAEEKETHHGPTFQRIRRQLNHKFNLRINQRMTEAQRGYKISAIEA